MIATTLEVLLTYSMVQSPSWEANLFAASQEIPRILWNLKVHYRTRVCHLSLSWASPIQSTYPHPTSWRSILILSTHLCVGLSSGLFPADLPTKTLYAPLSSPIHAICPAHLILLNFITCTILGEEYRSVSSSLCNLLHSPVTMSLLGPNILLNTILPWRSMGNNTELDVKGIRCDLVWGALNVLRFVTSWATGSSSGWTLLFRSIF